MLLIKHSYGTMIFDIKRYKYKYFIYQVFKVISNLNLHIPHVINVCVNEQCPCVIRGIM